VQAVAYIQVVAVAVHIQPEVEPEAVHIQFEPEVVYTPFVQAAHNYRQAYNMLVAYSMIEVLHTQLFAEAYNFSNNSHVLEIYQISHIA
jgi:hypothetical protein